MSQINAIDSLRRSIKKIGDAELKTELLGKVSDVQRDLATTRADLHTHRGELAHLRARLEGYSRHSARSPACVYDPPA